MKRLAVALLTALLGMALVSGLFAVRGVAHAASSNASALAAAKASLSKSPYATSKGNKIAVAAATMSYSRAAYQSQGATGTKAYLAICKKYLGSYYAKNKKQMQCNVPVAAAVRFSGVDKKFPTTNQGMYSYMKNSKKWKCLGNYKTKAKNLKPGDILIRIGGTTSYIGKNGSKHKASTNHACVYVGKNVSASVYKKTLKGTKADKGNPGSKRVFVSAHTSSKNPSKRSAACLETASQAYADNRLIVFRYVG